jgi:hypothetical protein
MVEKTGITTADTADTEKKKWKSAERLPFLKFSLRVCGISMVNFS